MSTKTPSKRRRKASSKNEKTFVVRIARDLSEYADVAVIAADTSEAEEIVTDLLSKPSALDDLNYEAEEGVRMFDTLHQRAISGTYQKPWLFGIEHLTIDHIGNVRWRDHIVEHYTFYNDDSVARLRVEAI